MTDSNPQLFSVSVKGIIQRQETILILKVANTEFWELPGAKTDKDQDAAAILRQSIKQKLPKARNIGIKQVIYASQDQFPLDQSVKIMLTYYDVKAWLGKSVKLSHEHEASHWVKLAEIDDYLMPATDRLAIMRVLRPKLLELE